MRFALLVPPGISKYKFAERLAEHYKVNVIDSHDMLLREVNSGTETGQDIKKQVDAGKTVSDDNIIYVLNKTLKEADYESGFILAGLPTNAAHAEALDKVLNKQKHTLAGLVYLDLDYDQLMEALTGQLTCRACKSTFNIYNSPPMMDGICDECGAKLYMRADDREETISRRIREYQTHLEQLKPFYKTRFFQVSADISGHINPDTLYEAIEKAVTGLKPKAKAKAKPKAKPKAKAPAKTTKAAPRKKTTTKKT
jgi:adenylate kinase